MDEDVGATQCIQSLCGCGKTQTFYSSCTLKPAAFSKTLAKIAAYLTNTLIPAIQATL